MVPNDLWLRLMHGIVHCQVRLKLRLSTHPPLVRQRWCVWSVVNQMVVTVALSVIHLPCFHMQKRLSSKAKLLISGSVHLLRKFDSQDGLTCAIDIS